MGSGLCLSYCSTHCYTTFQVHVFTMESVEGEYGYLRNVEKNYRMDWPSKTSILETPERKRCRRSTSFADSGLGSSLFGSPPWKKVCFTFGKSNFLFFFFEIRR